MRLSLLLFVLFLYGSLVNAQTTTVAEVNNSPVVYDFEEEFVNNPTASKVVSTEFRNVDGSPFFTDDWLRARLIIDSNKQYENVYVRLNVYDNKVHFRDFEGKERMLAARITEVTITDAESPLKNTIFICGIAPNKNIFYRVLTDGPKIRLLEKLSARKTDVKVFNGEPKFQYDIDKELWFFSRQAKNMYKQTKKCVEIMQVFNDDKRVTDFVAKNGIRCHKKDEVIKLVNYYNSY